MFCQDLEPEALQDPRGGSHTIESLWSAASSIGIDGSRLMTARGFTTAMGRVAASHFGAGSDGLYRFLFKYIQPTLARDVGSRKSGSPKREKTDHRLVARHSPPRGSREPARRLDMHDAAYSRPGTHTRPMVARGVSPGERAGDELSSSKVWVDERQHRSRDKGTAQRPS